MPLSPSYLDALSGGTPTGVREAPRIPAPQIQQQEQVAPAPQDPLDFFTQGSGPQPEGFREAFKMDEDAWWSAFASQYHDRTFSSLEDYMDFVGNLKDSNGRPVAFQEIGSFIKKSAMEYMPPNIKRQFNERMEERQAIAKEEAKAKHIERMNKRFAGSGIAMGMDGNTYRVKSTSEIEMEKVDRKRKMAELNLKAWNEHMRREPQPAKFGGEESGRDDNYERRMANWEQIGMRLEQRYYDSYEEARGSSEDEQSGSPTREQAIEELRRRGVM